MADEPIFLCTQQDLIDDDAGQERAVYQLTVLGGICEKLGYRLMSGVAPNLHELWAQRIVEPAAPARREMTAGDFERRFLAWLHITHGVLPESQAGTNAFFWRFQFHGSEVSFVIVGQGKNTGLPMPANTDWLLRVEEVGPETPFTASVAEYFEPGAGLRRVMSTGTIRTQFKSGKLILEFDDQSSHT